MIDIANAIPAEVIHVMGRMGVKGVVRVRCKLLDSSGKVLTRNAVGPIRRGDVVMLKETEMESGGRM